MTNFLPDNAPNDSNKITRFSDAHFNSAPMPPLPNAAFGINNNIMNASMDRNASKNGQKMTDFLSDFDSIDQDSNTSCFDSNPSLTLLFAEGLHDTGIKDAPLPKMTTKNGLKLTAFSMDDDPTSQDDITLLYFAHFNNVWSPIPLITACTKDIGIEDVPMTEKQPERDRY